jgi:HSP20 family protein
MARATLIKPRKAETLINEVEQMRNDIMQRAYDLFCRHGGQDLDNWLTAESELTWRPAIEVSGGEKQIVVKAAVPGIAARDLEVLVTPDDLLIRAEVKHEHSEKDGDVLVCELRNGRIFRNVRFPRQIDPDKVKAEYKDGLLTLRAPIAKEKRGKKVTVTEV